MIRSFSRLGILTLLLLAGCNLSSHFEKVDPDAVSSSKTYFDFLRHGQFEELEKVLDPSINGTDIRNTLTSMATLIPNQNPEAVKTVWAHTSCSVHTCDTTTTLEYKYPATRLILTVVIRREGSESSVVGFHLQPISESLMEANRFTLKDRGVSQYTALTLAVLFPLFSVYALVLCVRTKNLKRKWLWAIFILLGIGRLSVLWTTGQCFFTFSFIQLLSAGAIAKPYGPWEISISMPLGAILFLIYQSKLNKSKECIAMDGNAREPAESVNARHDDGR
jgi:hypothetical protein